MRKNVGMVGLLQKIKIWGWGGKKCRGGDGRDNIKNKNLGMGVAVFNPGGGGWGWFDIVIAKKIEGGGGGRVIYKPAVHPKY